MASSQTEATVEVEEELKNVNLEIEGRKQARRNLLKLVEDEYAASADISERLSEIRESLTRLETRALEARAKVSNEKALIANPDKVLAYAKKLETYLRGTNLDLTKAILSELIVKVRVYPGEQKDTANVAITYRLPTPLTGWTEKTDMETVALRKNTRSCRNTCQSRNPETLLCWERGLTLHSPDSRESGNDGKCQLSRVTAPSATRK